MPIKYDDGDTQKKIKELAAKLQKRVVAALLEMFNTIGSHSAIKYLSGGAGKLDVFTGNLKRSILGLTSSGFDRVVKTTLSAKVQKALGVGKPVFGKGTGENFGIREIRKSGTGKWIGTFGTKVKSKGATGFDYPAFWEGRGGRPFLKPALSDKRKDLDKILSKHMKILKKEAKID